MSYAHISIYHRRDPAQATRITISKNEEFWIQVIRQATRDSDPPPTLDRVRKLRALFRE